MSSKECVDERGRTIRVMMSSIGGNGARRASLSSQPRVQAGDSNGRAYLIDRVTSVARDEIINPKRVGGVAVLLCFCLLCTVRKG